MCGRLQYYCLVQIISRIGATWYQIQFGFRETVTQSPSTFQTAVFAIQFLLTPTAGIGYLIVFLAMQPEALLHLKNLLQRSQLFSICCSSCCLNCFEESLRKESCQYCWCVHPPRKRKRRKVFRSSEESVSSTMEQRILEDLRESEDLQTSEIEPSDGVGSWSSSHFLGDDQELAEELERLYREGKCGVTSIERITIAD
jgi:hypothetical protein